MPSLDAAARAELQLQVCNDCGTVLYPEREACSTCLSVNLAWKHQTGAGELIADTELHHSNDPYFAARLPWRTGTVKLTAGPVLIAHVHKDCAPAPTKVRVTARIDQEGRAVLIALPPQQNADLTTDPKLQDLTAHL